MSSSKFAGKFFKKTPLYGAYSSGAGGMVTVSYDDVHQKFQDGLAANVAKAYTKKEDPCSNLVQKLSANNISNAAYKTLSEKCAKKDDESTEKKVVKDSKPNKNIPTETNDQNRARYDLPPNKPNQIVNVDEIIKIGQEGLGQPCPPGYYRDPITGICN